MAGRVKLTEADKHLMNRLIQGVWSTDELIEASVDVDETSTASCVGSGTDRAIGTVSPVVPFQDEKLEKILREFEDYLKTSTSKPTTEAKRFGERRALPESWVLKLVEFARKKS